MTLPYENPSDRKQSGYCMDTGCAVAGAEAPVGAAALWHYFGKSAATALRPRQHSGTDSTLSSAAGAVYSHL